MDAHRKIIACIAVFVMLACMVPVTADCEYSDAYGDSNGILLYQVSSGTDKGVTLKNYSTATIDLKGYSVSDNEKKSSTEGYFTFEKSFKLGPGDTVTIALQNTGTPFTNRENVYVLGSNSAGITLTSKFNPASDDDIYLYDASGNIIDAMCYGNKTITTEDYWSGEPAKKGKTFLQRTGFFDTDTAQDWTNYGLTNYELEVDKYEATVTPFLFPDSGGIPIYQTLESAQESVCIEIYMLSSENVYGLLLDLVNRGIDVKILHSGNALGQNYSAITPYLKSLVEAGADVKFILQQGNVNNRFSYVHCKYAIVDSDKVIVTSENWTKENCNGSLDDDPYSGKDMGNRGWGVIVESDEYAQYMKNVFDNDYSTEYGDVKDFDVVYPNANSITPTYTSHVEADFDSYNASITPVLSNDNSYDAIEYLIDRAEDRIYSQQQNLNSYSFSDDSPIVLMANAAEANRNLDAKFILNAGEENAKDLVFRINSQTYVSATTMSTPYVHNKGIISDDMALVTSINWTVNSVNNNREVGVIIHSKDVADFYATAFNNDFARNYTYDGFQMDTSGIPKSYESGKETAIEISVTPESGNYVYSWDFGDGQSKTTTVNRTVFVPTEGSHTMTITVTDDSGMSSSVTVKYTVGNDSDSSTSDWDDLDIEKIIDEYGYYIIPIIVVILGIIGAALKHR